MNYGSVRQAPRSMRRPKSWRKGIFVGVFIAGLVLLLLLLVILAISIYVGWSLSHPERRAVHDTPSNYGLGYQELELESKLDQTKLLAWQVESPHSPKGVLIFSHGYGMNRLQSELPALDLTKKLVEAGYHVLLFDYRNSGQSEGSLTSIGYYEQEDLITFVDYAQLTYPDLPVGVIGFSMGAATALVAAEKADAIQAVVADSPFSDLREYLEGNLPHWSNLPDFPFTAVILTVVPWLTGIDIDQVSPREALADLRTPVLLIHGKADQAIPYQQSEHLLASSRTGFVSLWLVPEAGHVYAYSMAPEEYANKVIQFFDQAFNVERQAF